MATYTSKAPGDFNADGQTTWNEAGHPDGADDTVTISHAITASAGITCGAITVADGGSLDTGTSAATITSITTSGNGAVTIGAGGCTFAGVLNNSGTGTLTINGVCTGVTNFTTGECAMNADVTMTGTLVAPGTGQTFAMAAGVTLSGVSANVASYAGAWTMAAGSTFSGNIANALVITVAGSFTCSGASDGIVSILNAAASRNVSVINNGVVDWTHVNIRGMYTFGTTDGHATRMRYVEFEPNSSGALPSFTFSRDGAPKVCDIKYVWLSGDLNTGGSLLGHSSAGSGCYFPEQLTGMISDVAIGYTREGASEPVTTGISFGMSSKIANCIINATTQVSILSHTGSVLVENLGYVSPLMVQAESTLAGNVSDPGISRQWFYRGDVLKSADAKKTGDYGAKCTPSAECSSTTPLELSLYLPISSGDNLSVSVHGLRSQMTDDCAEIEIDPEGAWYTPVTGTATMTNEDAWYEFTATRTGAGGTGATGMVRIVLRVKEYEAANYFYWADFTATIGGVDYTVDFAEWSQGIPVATMVATTGGVGNLINGGLIQ